MLDARLVAGKEKTNTSNGTLPTELFQRNSSNGTLPTEHVQRNTSNGTLPTFRFE